MKRPPLPLQYVVVAATRATAMTSRPSFRGGRSQRGYSSRPYSSGGRGHYVTGDSHIRSVRDANLGFRQGDNTGTFTDQTNPHFHHPHNSNQLRRPPPSDHNQPYRPNHLFRPPQQYRIRPRPQKPLDYRNWEYAKTTLPPNSEKFMVLSYNILADYLANDHRGKLYYHIPGHMMDWQWRKKNLLFELGLWSADILCFQEVDRFGELEEELRIRGYNGIWKMRTGNPVDGCAVFWRMYRFKLLHEECIEFSRLGLRHNVAQICVLESLHQTPKESNAAFSTGSRGSNKVVICNIHVLYNPRRGEIKLGQLRVLLDKARAASKLWNDAPIVLCGDFNCTPKSPLYNFISEQKLELSEVDRDKVSGQASAEIGPPGSYNHNYRGQHGSVQGLPMLQGKEVETKPDNSDSLNQNSQEKGEEDTQLLSQPQVSNTGDISGDSCSDVHSEKDDACHAEANKETKHTSVDVSKVESESALHVQGDGFKEDPSTSIGEGYMSVECTSDPTDSYACVEKESMSCSILNLSSTKENLITGVGCDPGFVNRFDSKVSPSEVSGQTSFADAIEGSPLGTLGHFPSESSFVVDKDISCASNSVDLEEQKKLENLSLTEHDEAISEAGKTTEDDGTFLSALHTGDGSTSDFASDPPKYMLPASSDRTEDGLSPEMDSDLVGVGKYTYDPALWTPMEIETATGNGECTLLEHPLKLRSTYTEVEDCSGTRDSNGEPLVTSYNRCFFGTVDYIWRSEGLQTVRVLAPIPKHSMQWTSGFPTRKWGSDHIALASELVFTNCCDES